MENLRQKELLPSDILETIEGQIERDSTRTLEMLST
jgi:hypothetical protein